jgi:GNAT superfamily N-acetyltransferase
MNIRLANESDAPAIADLCGQMGYPAKPEEVSRRLGQITQSEQYALFIAEVDGQVAGWIHVVTYPLLDMDLHAELGGLVVNEAQRGQGIGRALMLRAEQWARRGGCREMRIRSNMTRTGSHEFYKKAGFEIIKSQYTFRKIL